MIEDYVELESVLTEVPHNIRFAAYQYIIEGNSNNSRDEEEKEFVDSLGESTVGSVVHQQLSWLCINALSMAFPGKFRYIGTYPEDIFSNLRKWLHDPTHTVDWSAAITPAIPARRDCVVVSLVAIADAVASAAQCLKSAQSIDAVECLGLIYVADDGGCYIRGARDTHRKWLISV